MIRMLKLSAVMATVVLAGCSTLGVGEPDFSCNKAPGGIPCTSLQDAYSASNRTLADVPKTQDELKAQQAAWAAPRQDVGRGLLPVRTKTQSAADQNSQVFVEDADVARVARPAMEPAKVLRVWVAPWVDEEQTLHWPTHLFTEITPRKWSYGAAMIQQSKQVLFPVQVDDTRGGRSRLTTPPVGNNPGSFSNLNLQNAAQGLISGAPTTGSGALIGK